VCVGGGGPWVEDLLHGRFNWRDRFVCVLGLCNC